MTRRGDSPPGLIALPLGKACLFIIPERI